MGPGFVGRRSHLQALEDFVEKVPDGPRSLCLQGEAGIGKTSIWDEGVHLAEKAGCVVLTARAAQAEASLAFTAVGDLFSPVLEVTLGAIPAVQRRALETALLLREPGVSPPDARVLGLAVLSAVRELARDRPLVIAVDDLQWVDRASAQMLAFMTRRLGPTPVGILVTVRGVASHAPPEVASALPELQVVDVPSLPLDDTRRMLLERLDLQLSRPQLVQLHKASGGNPFLVLQLASALVEGTIELTDGPILLPPSIIGFVTDRLQRLPPSTLQSLVAVAALAAPTITLLEQLSPSGLDDIERARARGLVRLEGDRIQFTHPLLASACYAAMVAPRRRQLHRRLAVLDLGLEQRAHHLAIAATGPADEIAASLDVAAAHAAARGAAQAAAELAVRAVSLTPPRSVQALNHRRIEAAIHCRTAGDPNQATRLLQAVIDSVEPGPLKARALGELADVRASLEGFRIAENLYLLALDQPGLTPAERAQLLGQLAWRVSAGGYREHGSEYADAGLRLAEESGDPEVLAVNLAGVAELTFWRTGRLRRDLLDRAAEIEQVAGRDLDARATLARLLARCDRHVEARSLFASLIAAARSRDDAELLGHLLFLARMELAAGEWSTTERLCEEALTVADHIGEESTESLFRMVLAELAAYRGEAETARSEIRDLLHVAEESGYTGAVHRLSRALGCLELSCGNPAESLRQVEPLCCGFAELSEVQAQLAGSVAIEALVALEDLRGAEALLGQLDEIAAEADSSLQVLADRSRGQLLAARGEEAGAIEAFEIALSSPDADRGANPLESTRTMLGLGTTLRHAQHKRAARDVLLATVDGFERLGATTWSARARSELRRIGGRTASDDELSETERLIAERVADGLRNKEVAADLHLSPNTVSWNLSKIYRKLGVSSRTELAARLARRPP